MWPQTTSYPSVLFILLTLRRASRSSVHAVKGILSGNKVTETSLSVGDVKKHRSQRHRPRTDVEVAHGQLTSDEYGVVQMCLLADHVVLVE